MAPDNSTEKGAGKRRNRKPQERQISHEFEGIIERLRYVGEYLFGGNMAAYAKAVGLSEYWLGRVLDSSTRVRVSTLSHFVRSRIVAAEWLFCGTGPMLTKDINSDDIDGFFVSGAMNSRYPVFDSSSAIPVPPVNKSVSFVLPGSGFSGPISTACVPAAYKVFIARQNQKPVLMFVSPAVIQAGVAPVIIDMLKKQYITGIAMTIAAAEQDYLIAGGTDMDAFYSAVIAGADAGFGLGESLGQKLLIGEARSSSVLAAAYDLNVPVTIHSPVGAVASHYRPMKETTEFGAAFGAASYVDSLIFAEQVQQMAGDLTSVFINTGSVFPGTELLATTMQTLQQTRRLNFQRLKLLRLSAKQIESAADVCVCAPYRELFPALLVSCDAVYEGGFDVYTNKNTGEQFAAFGFIKHCAENVRDKPKAKRKR